jgi:hypothetical protein
LDDDDDAALAEDAPTLAENVVAFDLMDSDRISLVVEGILNFTVISQKENFLI